jgi:serine/threonine protein kinase/ActR/RegA family two-component response regulator
VTAQSAPSATQRLLVVDDNEMNRDVLSRQLQRRGYTVDMANDGVHALERCSGTRYDLILLDIMMPRMNGIEVVRELRKTLSRTELPILMVTAKNDSADVVEALKLGANDYIVKPFSFAVVAARVEAALRMSSEARRPSSGLFGEEAAPSSLLRATLACPYCTTALLNNPDECTDCGQARPRTGWPPPSPVDSPHFARVIGRRYFLERYITEGSSGEVFRCRDLDLGRIFAAKIIDVSSDTKTDEETLRERIRVEVKALVRIRNPHVVKIYEVLRLAPKVYALIMDYVRGESLGTLLGGGQVIEPHAALSLIRQVAQGLYAAHQLSMIHRDVKPDNIMVERLPAGDYFAQLLDFGIVSRLGDTVTGESFYGTPLYASPEQSVYHRPVDHRADVYSLGAVLYHMLTGFPPFLGDTVEDILREHASTPVPALPGLADSAAVTEALDELLAKMMTKSPEQRFSSMKEVIGYIDELLPLLSYEDVLPSSADPLSETMHPESDLKRSMAERRPVRTLRMEDEVAPAGSPAASVSHTRLRYPIRTITETIVTGSSHALVVEQAGEACHVTSLDFANATIARWLVLEHTTVRAVALSSCGHFFAVAESEGPAIRVFGTASRREMRSWTWAVSGVSVIALSHEARMIAVGTESGGLAVADTWGSNQPLELPNMRAAISAVSFAPNSAAIAVGADDNVVRLIAVPSGELLASSKPLVAPPVEMAFLADGAQLSVLTSAGHVVTLRTVPLEPLAQMRLTGLTSIRYDEEKRVMGLVACDGDWDLVDCAAITA